MEAVAVDVLVLNYNGRELLAECLPSIVRAAAASRHDCRVTVVDNDSTDDSLAWLVRHHPTVAVRRLPNRGLCSFNDVLRDSSARIALLLNNDLRVDEHAFDPLIDALLEPLAAGSDPIWATAPRCFLFDGRTHEGFQTAVGWRYGVVQGTAHFHRAPEIADRPGLTAMAGAALAVDRAVFIELGGFDPRYLPGRIEDLDLCYRAFLSGRRMRYVPEAQFYHRGGATFDACHGRAASERLALRNTLLFQRTHLWHARHRLQEWFWRPLRVLRDVVRAPFVATDERFAFCRAWIEARRLYRRHGPAPHAAVRQRERDYFLEHSPQRLLAAVNDDAAELETWRTAESRREADFPFSRWYVRPAALALAARLAKAGVRPTQVTLVGVACAVAAALTLVLFPSGRPIAAAWVLAAWLCDRIDGPLARRRGSASAWGAWFDANVDEGVDLGLHVAVAAAAAQATGSPLPWTFLIAFFFGKYLLMHGLASDDVHTGRTNDAAATSVTQPDSVWRRLYHWPGNADVRLHLLLGGIVTGWLTWELAIIAGYYNLRWIARFGLLARRLRTAAPTTTGAAA